MRLDKRKHIRGMNLKIIDKNYNKIFNLVKKNAKILELGCGNGELLDYLYHKGYKNLFAVDIDRCKIEKLKRYQVFNEDINTFITKKTNMM